jgi:hypothetical protein
MKRLIIATVLLVSACTTGPSREAIDAARLSGREPGTIAVGDSADYVRLQWGEPYAVRTIFYENGYASAWAFCWLDYRNQPVCPSTVLLDRGTVIEIARDTVAVAGTSPFAPWP